jgi:hypothetical protein
MATLAQMVTKAMTAEEIWQKCTEASLTAQIMQNAADLAAAIMAAATTTIACKLAEATSTLAGNAEAWLTCWLVEDERFGKLTYEQIEAAWRERLEEANRD